MGKTKVAASIDKPTVMPYGDRAILIQYRMSGFDIGICRTVQAKARRFRAQSFWTEVVSGYDSLLLTYNPLRPDISESLAGIEAVIEAAEDVGGDSGRLVEIPVYYGYDDGPDIDIIRDASGLSYRDIIETHCAREYLVCMMGFIPGFTFLSAAPPVLHHPRKATPRAHVPAGSIGIAGWQTGIYGQDSPGGWQIIGRTPETIFDARRETPFLIEAGDRVKFVPADRP